jgi:GTP-binding protein YchF
MGLNCGIIGLPNVGKSTIFNALTGAGAQMENYPFCTIEPNMGIVPVPDTTLFTIGEILDKKNPIPTKMEFIDVAGLVKGASKGEGLGNQFLGNIRNVDAIVQIVRCFTTSDVVHVTGDVDPLRDIEIINTELILSDIEVLERAQEKLSKLFKSSGDKNAKKQQDIVEKFIDHLNNGNLLKTLELDADESEIIEEYGIITNKPFLYVSNVDEGDINHDLLKKVDEYAAKEGSEHIFISGKIEEEISELPNDEKKEYLDAMGIEAPGLDRLIHASYKLLDLITYYTTATELQAWTLQKGTVAQKAAGKIHTDFEKGFIRSEVMRCSDLIELGSEHAVKEKGLLKFEGKDYVVKEGDVIKYLFNV